jgi:VIT1/CCC1 family predicted Fe2+/Mn2+ transporter
MGATMPLMPTLVAPVSVMAPAVAGASLALLGGLAARAGDPCVMSGALGALFWGAIAMAVTAAVGALLGTVV